MALFHSSNSHLQSSNLVLILFHIFLFFSFFIVSATPLSFNYPKFPSDMADELEFQGDAYHSPSNTLALTIGEVDKPFNFSAGRVIYKKPIHLWDNATNNLTDFITHFSFSLFIDKNAKYMPGDGFTFFLAPNSFLPPLPTGNTNVIPSSSGQFLGLFDNKTATNEGENQAVAVEFDTYSNDGEDPSYRHVGIDVNAIISVKEVQWDIDGTNEVKGDAQVSYNSRTKDLNVFLIYVDGEKGSETLSLSYRVDLRNKLPECVNIGFSASTGWSYELHSILSWNFSSSLEIRNSSSLVISNNSKPNKGLVVGLVIGTSALIGCLVMILLVLKKKRNRSPDASMDEDFERETGPKKFSYGELVRATNNFNRELLLVYEFMPNGSLDSHLFKGKTLLTWKVRYNIALGLVSALLYLHEEWEQCVVHRDIKSSNVMLDSSFKTKLGDFGLAKLVEHEQGAETTEVLAGTKGYMAPEYTVNGKASKESDVYSFGVVALEIACGRRPVEPSAGQGRVILVDWVWELYGKGMLREAIDPRLTSTEGFDEKQVEHLMVVGLWCAHPDYNRRPSMREVMHVLRFEAQLPVIPSKMSVPTFALPPDASVLEISSSVAGSSSKSTMF
ncbi:PREDICTED: L-type lectin-domain containing receptor kinase IX.1-like [Nelumbo nucifera]|uniref:non-specific serine/threonine protein kinase n=1 Tax=Nelumbo nucifera TaxID=4432 RepID=A0A1U8A436_NELNU|nr:PREDICTED: L-type lectin-domain containing receptor kinase IX.1-like [Nelumbo nucifera]